jgi:hypothetical protein
MDEKRKPLWPKIVVTVLLLPVLYVASIGPIVWVLHRIGTGHEELPTAVALSLEIYAMPIDWLYDHSPGAIREWFRWYIELFTD